MYELSDQEKKLMEEYEVMMAERRHPDCAIFLERCKTEGIDPPTFDNVELMIRWLLEHNRKLIGDVDLSLLSRDELYLLSAKHAEQINMPVPVIRHKVPYRDRHLTAGNHPPRYGYWKGVDMGKVHAAAWRLTDRVKKGHLCSVSVARHYTVLITTYKEK